LFGKGVVISDEFRNILSLPARLGGLSIDDTTKDVVTKHLDSMELTRCLQDAIRAGGGQFDKEEVKKAGKVIKARRAVVLQLRAKEMQGTAGPRLRRALVVAEDKGASAIFSARPLEEYGFSFRSKRDYRDLLRLRYGIEVNGLPYECACGRLNSVGHTQQCPKGGFIMARHDEMERLWALQCKKIFNDVECEPQLEELEGEEFRYGSANVKEEARSDVRVRNFWGNRRNAFFDFRVFYPFASSYFGKSLSALYKTASKEKKREYAERVQRVEDGSFTPMVMSSTGGMGPEMSVALKFLAAGLAVKEGVQYSSAVNVLRCRFAFASARAALVCLRGSRSLFRNRRFVQKVEGNDAPLALVAADAGLIG
jgi:hypothetical protein